MMKILVTGGAGFIGSNLVRQIIDETSHHVINIEKLTYAENLSSLGDCLNHPNHTFNLHCDLTQIPRKGQIILGNTTYKLLIFGK